MKVDKPIYRRWDPPVETHLGDIHGWMEDIHCTHDFASRLRDELAKDNPELVLLDALSTAALVRYCRCFTTGIRARLSIEGLPSASAEDITFHERVRGIRDWHVAHPVNEQEVHALYVILDGSPGATTGAIGFSSFCSAEGVLQPFEVDTMLGLCEKWLRWLSSQLMQEEMSLRPRVSLLPREELLALPNDEPEPNPNIRAKRRQVRSADRADQRREPGSE